MFAFFPSVLQYHWFGNRVSIWFYLPGLPAKILFYPAQTAVNMVIGYRPAKSHASRVRLTHFRWVSRSHSAQWKSHAFSCSAKNNIFNVTTVLLLWWEMRVLTPVLLLLTLGLLTFMCGSIRHMAQWQCPGCKLVHSKWLCKCRLVLGSTSTQFTVCGTVSI